MSAGFLKNMYFFGCVGSSLQYVGSVAVLHAGLVTLGHVQSVSRLGIKPVFPALEDRFLTTGLPGKSLWADFTLRL